MNVSLVPHEPSRGPARSASLKKVAYVMSRFPKLTETFVLLEILALERCGVTVEIYPLLRARNSSAHPEGVQLWRKVLELFRKPAKDAVMHPEAAPLVARAHYAPFINWAIVTAQFGCLFERPRAYLKALGTIVRANWGSANYLLGALAIFPKAVYFARCMERSGVQHVHAHFANHPAAAAFVIHAVTGISYSFTGHGADLQVDQHMLREKVAAARWVVTISDYNREFILDVCGRDFADRVQVIRCGVDTRLFRPQAVPRPADPARRFTLVCTGTLYEVKGQAYLIEACRLLKERGVPIQCHLVGDGPMRDELAAAIHRLGLGDEVLLRGKMNRAQIAELLRDANALVAPSVPAAGGRREGIPVVLMEAMASGLPVVASAISGIPELVTDEVSGLLVPPRDPGRLAEALGRLWADPEWACRLGSAGRAKIIAEYDLNANSAQLLCLMARDCT